MTLGRPRFAVAATVAPGLAAVRLSTPAWDAGMLVQLVGSYRY